MGCDISTPVGPQGFGGTTLTFSQIPPRPQTPAAPQMPSAGQNLQNRLVISHLEMPQPQHGVGSVMDSTAHYSQPPAPYIPPPQAATKKKHHIFNIKDFTAIDEKAKNVPIELLQGSFEQLVKFLTEDAGNDICRVRALFTFLANLDIEALAEKSSEQKVEPGTPLHHILNIHGKKTNNAHVFFTLCGYSGLTCQIISGINKNSEYQLGRSLQGQKLEAQWNAVVVAGEWRLIDTYWASATATEKPLEYWTMVNINDKGEASESEDEEEDKKEEEDKMQVKEFFFLPDPEQFVYTHLAYVPAWQLLPFPVYTQQFESHFYVRERFHELKMSQGPLGHRECILKTMQGEVLMPFGIPPSDAPHLQFRYILYQQNKAEDIEDDIQWDRFVLYQKTSDSVSYMVRFPVTGIFRIDIYGMHVKKHGTYELACSYMIDCAEVKKDCEPLPDCPEIGWGPGVEAEKVGMHPISHPQGVIHTTDGHIEIRFALEHALSVMQHLCHNDFDSWKLKRYAILYIEGAELVVRMRLPKQGEFALNMFADEEGKEGDLPNVCNYLIACNNPLTRTLPFPKLNAGILGKGPLAQKFAVCSVGHEIGLIKTEKNNLDLSFSHPDNEELFCELNYVTQDKFKTASYVEREKERLYKTTFHLDFPGQGEYGVNVYAKRSTERLYHMYCYLVIYGNLVEGTIIEENVQVEIAEVLDENIEFRIPKSPYSLLGELERKNALGTPVDDQVVVDTEDYSEVVFRLSLPELGEYCLDVMEVQDNYALVHVKTYIITRKGKAPRRLSQMAAEGDLLGGIAKMKKQHEHEKKEFQKAQDVNKTRMKQGLEEKLKERMAKRNRQSITPGDDLSEV